MMGKTLLVLAKLYKRQEDCKIRFLTAKDAKSAKKNQRTTIFCGFFFLALLASLAVPFVFLTLQFTCYLRSKVWVVATGLV